MIKHLKNIVLLGTIMLLLAACATPTAKPTAMATEKPAITSTPIVITATPMPVTETVKAVNTKAATITNTPYPKVTYTPSIPGAYNKEGTPITSKSSIIITKVKSSGADQAQMTWIATGTFADGFRIIYSDTVVNPVKDSEASEYEIRDGLTRSAYITGKPGTTYYYRICAITGSTCEFYSNSFTFSFPAATSTP